jgi:adenylate cyclase
MLLLPTEHWVLPSFSLLLLEQAVRGGHLRPPPLPTGEFLINYRGGPKTFDTISFHRVVTGEIDPERFAGKIVLVGATTPTLHDVFATPFAARGDMPGVEIHANVLETLMLGVPIRPIHSGIVATLTVAAGAFAVLVPDHASPPAFVAVAGALVTYLGLSHAAFRVWYLWVGVTTVPLTLALGYTGAAVTFIIEQREERRLSRFFTALGGARDRACQHAGEALQSGRRRLVH